MDMAGLIQPIHADSDLCNFLLGSVQSAFRLNIIESNIPCASSGITTTDNIPFGAEIFRVKEALWNVPIN